MKYLDYTGLQYFWSKLKALFQTKQDVLVSGTNIKTVNGNSILGSGNIQAGEPDAVKYVSQTLTEAQKAQARTNISAVAASSISALETAIAAKYSKPSGGIPETDLASAVQSALALARTSIQSLADYYSKTEVDALLDAVGSEQYVDVTTLPTASASTLGKIYLVGPDVNGFYDRYYTSYDGSTYSWVPAGNTEINLANYATKEEVSQLRQDVDGIFREVGVEQPEGLGISDESGNVIAKFENGHIQTKEFNSAESPRVASGTTKANFGISDEKGNVIVKFEDGHIKTKNFDSSDIEGGSGYNSIPSYFEDEITDTESKIEAITSTGVATIVMPIVTDNHIDWTDRDKERVMETLSCIHKINKDNGLDAVANLGDIPTMWGRNGVTDTEIFSRLKWYIDTYKGVHKNVFFANGNHDGESSDFFNKEKWYPLTKYNKGIVVRNGNSPYFYYDFADMKVRFIFMSIPCSTDETRTTQGITTYYPSEKTVHTYWGAGQEQLNWLANDALKTGDGWKVVLLSHTPVCYNYPTHNGIYDLMGRVEDQADIEGIFNAYHNHSIYSSTNVSCNFTAYSNTKMLLAIAGHVHADMIIDSGQKPTGNFNTNGLPCKIVVISCQMMNRMDKTVNQDQYDYMVYNGKTDQFNFIRFGNGSDRVITF